MAKELNVSSASIAFASAQWAANLVKEGKYAASRKITEVSVEQKFDLASEWASVNHEFYELEHRLVSLANKVEKLAEKG